MSGFFRHLKHVKIRGKENEKHHTESITDLRELWDRTRKRQDLPQLPT